VEEQILVRSRVDKSEAFVRQSLNRTFSHFVQLPKKILCGVARNKRAQAIPPQASIVSGGLVTSKGKGFNIDQHACRLGTSARPSY
jgi:hypothetical protein